MDNCTAYTSPMMAGTVLLSMWRDEESRSREGAPLVDKGESCLYKTCKRAIALPAGLVLSTAAIVESAVKSIFALLLFPMICFDATSGFYNEVIVGVMLVGFVVGAVGIVSSLTQLATKNFFMCNSNA
ncbi:MAG: hypothetical protein HY860_04960 [Chlamydiales bacterium]|nr:hypothetical protein [Chlamydiales bacterium]